MTDETKVTKATNISSELKTKASKKLEEEIKQELEKETPELEKARASVKDAET